MHENSKLQLKWRRYWVSVCSCPVLILYCMTGSWCTRSHTCTSEKGLTLGAHRIKKPIQQNRGLSPLLNNMLALLYPHKKTWIESVHFHLHSFLVPERFSFKTVWMFKTCGSSCNYIRTVGVPWIQGRLRIPIQGKQIIFHHRYLLTFWESCVVVTILQLTAMVTPSKILKLLSCKSCMLKNSTLLSVSKKKNSLHLTNNIRPGVLMLRSRWYLRVCC